MSRAATTCPPETATRTFGPRPPRPAPPTDARRRLPAILTRPASLLAVGLVAAVAVTLLAWPTGGRTSVAEPGLSRPAWAEVLAGLDAQRAAAFATGEPEALHRVYAEHTAALRSDVDVLRGYVRRHLRVAGLRHELVSVDVLRETPDRVTLRVVDTIPAFRVLDPDGRVVERLTGRPERAWVLTLVRSGARWQISELASA